MPAPARRPRALPCTPRAPLCAPRPVRPQQPRRVLRASLRVHPAPRRVVHSLPYRYLPRAPLCEPRATRGAHPLLLTFSTPLSTLCPSPFPTLFTHGPHSVHHFPLDVHPCAPPCAHPAPYRSVHSWSPPFPPPAYPESHRVRPLPTMCTPLPTPQGAYPISHCVHPALHLVHPLHPALCTLFLRLRPATGIPSPCSTVCTLDPQLCVTHVPLGASQVPSHAHSVLPRVPHAPHRVCLATPPNLTQPSSSR